MKTILFILIPLMILAQTPNYPDTLYTLYGYSYPCFITSLDSNQVKIIHKNRISGKTGWVSLSKVIMGKKGLIYSKESGFLYDLDSLIAFMRNRPNPFLPTAQDSTNAGIVRLVLKDGSVLIGRVIREDETTLQIRSESGVESIIPKNQIVQRKIITEKIVKGEYWIDDPNSTRLFFAPTGRALKAGQGYFSAYQIFFPFIAVGITDYFTLAGGISLFPGAESQLLYLAPKITPVTSEKFSLSAGVLYLNLPGEEEAAGIVYSVGTFGSEQSALTLGIGYGFSGGEFADNPVLALGGEARVGRLTKLVTENWFFLGGDVQLLSGGIRFFGESLAADFALILPIFGGAIEGFPFIPWIGFAYNFGSK